MNTTTPSKSDKGFARLLLTSFQYPFHGDGPYLMLGGGVMFAIADFVSAYASIGGVLIQVSVSGYLAAYAKDVVQTSAMGEDAPPAWVDFTDWMEDVVMPAVQLLVVVMLSFGLTIFLQYRHPFTPDAEILEFLAGVWGCLTFPIFFLTVAITDSMVAVLNPIPLVRAVWLTLPDYLLVCSLCGLIIGLCIRLAELEDLTKRIPILPHLVGWLVSLYLLTVLMRSFGLLYHHHHGRLQWY